MARQPSRSQSEQQRAHHGTTAGNSQRRKIRPHRQGCCGFPISEELQQVAIGQPREQNRQGTSAECKQNRLNEELLISEGAFVCARWRLRGTQTADYVGLTSNGRSIDVAICEVYEIAEDRVVTTWAYQDPSQMFRQMASAATSEGIQ